MKFTKKQQNYLLITAVILSAVFFSLYKITQIPPGTQNDVVRAVLTSEQYLRGMDGGLTSIRQAIAYYLLGGYWSYFLIDLFRGSGNIEAMAFISRLPSAIFMVMSAFTWLRILSIFTDSIKPKLVFFMLFLPSSLFISYSHHIPLVAGYMFYTSLGIFFLVNAFNSKHVRIIQLAFSLFSFGVATFTHGISVFFMLIFIPLALLTAELYNNAITNAIKAVYRKPLKQGAKYLFVLLIASITLFPLIDGLLGSDRSLTVKSATSITYLIENNEKDLLIEKIPQKIFSYIHPNTLIRSEDIIEGEQPVNSPVFHDIKNAVYNQWVTTRLSPFGPITLLIYVIIPILAILLITRKVKIKDHPILLLIIPLFLSYILLPIFPNYDNPSVAKTITSLMFIPLTFMFITSLIRSKEYRFLIYSFIFLLMMNGLYSIDYLYSHEYQKNESAKYYIYSSREIADRIINSEDLYRIRIFLHTDNKDLQTALSLYLGPDVLNRVVTGRPNIDLFDENEHNFMIGHNEEDLKYYIQNDIIDEYSTLRRADGSAEFYFAEVPAIEASMVNSPSIISDDGILCTREPNYPIYTGEFEYLLYQYKYYDNVDGKFVLNNCDEASRKELHVLDPNNFIYDQTKSALKSVIATNPYASSPGYDLTYERQIGSDTTLKIDGIRSEFIFDDPVSIDTSANTFTNESGVIDKDSIRLFASEDPAKSSIKIDSQKSGRGTYLLQYDYLTSDYGYLDIYLINGDSGETIPIKLMLPDYTIDDSLNYSTLFYLDGRSTYYFGIDLFNRHYNIDKTEHPVRTEITDLKFIKLTPSNILAEKITIEPIRPDNNTTINRSVKREKLFPGVYRYNGVGEDGVIIDNMPYSPNLVTISHGVESSISQVNGISQSIQFTNMSSNDSIIVINSGLLYGSGLLLIHLVQNIALILIASSGRSKIT